MTQLATDEPSCAPLDVAWERQRNVIVQQLRYVSRIVNETGITGVSGACARACCWIRSVLFAMEGTPFAEPYCLWRRELASRHSISLVSRIRLRYASHALVVLLSADEGGVYTRG